MVTKPTGKPPGRPQIPLRDHPLRFDLALAEAIRWGRKVGLHRAIVLAVVELRARKTDAEPSPRLVRHLERGGTIVSYDISTLSGSPNETIDLSKRIQAVNTLEKMLRREVSDTDKEYFLKLATCMFSALFSKKSLDERATGIELLSREIGEEGHFAEMVAGM